MNLSQDIYQNVVNCKTVVRSQIKDQDPMEIEILKQ